MTRASLENRHRYGLPCGIEYLRHPDLSAE
jgi:hypothetical protein